MEELLCENFFDLSNFSHSKLLKSSVIDTIKDLKGFIDNLDLGNIESDIPESAILQNIEQISIGRDVIIEPGAFIKGPAVIGDGSTLRSGSYIRGFVITGKGCLLGHGAEVKGSILLNGVKVSHFSYVGDSIVGNFVNLAAGVRCANFRFDGEEISINTTFSKVKTGLKKFGAVIGDNTKVGCNSVINPGTIIGKGSICFPLISIRGYIEEGSFLKPTSSFKVERCL